MSLHVDRTTTFLGWLVILMGVMYLVIVWSERWTEWVAGFRAFWPSVVSTAALVIAAVPAAAQRWPMRASGRCGIRGWI